MEQLAGIIITIACGCILPIFGIWWGVRQKMNETNQRTQIILAAIEKNSETDVEDLLKKMAPKKRLLKEKLLSKLLAGCITAFLGAGFIAWGLFLECRGSSGEKGLLMSYFVGAILLSVGIAFFLNFFIGKKMLAKEMEAEEQKALLNS